MISCHSCCFYRHKPPLLEGLYPFSNAEGFAWFATIGSTMVYDTCKPTECVPTETTFLSKLMLDLA